MRKPKVIVAGCSFSDYVHHDEVHRNSRLYGDVLAEMTDREYIHEGAGAGSNWRMWRRIPQMVLSGEITRDDWVFIQYTGLERTEFWSDLPGHPANRNSRSQIETREPYKPYGCVLRYKAGSAEWQDNEKEKRFFRQYEQHHVLPEFCAEQFHSHNLQFQTFMLYHGIPTVFQYTRHGQQYPVLPELAPWVFTENWERYADHDRYDLVEGDRAHINDLGHTEWAEDLFKHVQALGWYPN